ncbi:hypothetical protein [Moorena sp. SIO3H5]|uniref:hypothetical protein n=1 Tax=Moorena sp. SIO3H5 TaxID=2607834 RepID=UPI0013BD5E3B|nr:hypothetical protein [Moorena sp. SIO3H5]NEO73322.1 hypothetical protein [Moorena sp. SIO3H5]
MQWPHGGLPHSRKAWLTMMIEERCSADLRGKPPVPLLHRFLITHTLHPFPLHPTPHVFVKNLPL